MSLRPGGGGRKGRGEGRTGKYKKSVDMVEARRRREEGFVEIRKNKRADSLSRKRRELASYPRLERVTDMAQRLWSEDLVEQANASKYFRMIIAIEENPPIDLVIKAGVVPRLVQFLLRKDQPSLQFEAAWTLTNVASGTSEQTQVVVDHGAVPNLVQLLSSPMEEVREQAVWALGNVAGDSSSCRDIILANGALIPLLSLLNPQSKLSMLRNAIWTMSNLFRGDPSPQFDQIKPALSVLPRLVYSNDDDILKNACCALAYLFNGKNYKIQDFIDTNICARLVELLMHPTLSVQIVALKTVTNIAAGDDMKAQLVIDNGVLPCLLQLLTHHHESTIRRFACRIISNIAAGNKSQVQRYVTGSHRFEHHPPLVSLIKQAEFDVKREVAWVILNATSEGTFEQIHFIANQGCIRPLCDLLVSPDPEAVSVCLEALENILKVGEAEKELGNRDGTNIYAQEVEDCDGLAKIEDLQFHPHASVSDAATRMLERYWEEEEVVKEERKRRKVGGVKGTTRRMPLVRELG
ncbi:unnamed protein product [Spirodela intermedia]|uniref:Importin subunit alpha n=1 Tax=Spirodela intermedia TaxID=51605 RepID=A0A7I8IFQ7_SPIIN|nr:unnamed protein product [Spirodela intermedia]CAA6656650.1 unnamed protein product [Spirodela intermedia]